jgi:UDP-glucose 4-epimerase
VTESRSRDHSETLIAVTGATGFLGAHVCQHLIAVGRRVRRVVRQARTSDAIRVADITDRNALRDAFVSADVVVHMVGRAHAVDDPRADPIAEYRRVNVDGTHAALDAARDARVRRFIFVSSVKAVSESSDDDGTPLRDDAPARPTTPYGVTKLEAEGLVLDAARAGMSATVIRLPLVYGPGVRANMFSLLRAVDRRLPLPFGLIRNARSLVFAGNVADAVASLVDGDLDAGTGPYFVTDEERVSTAELVRRVARVLDRSPMLLPVPEIVFRATRAVAMGVRGPGERIASAIDRLTGSLAVDSSAFWRVVGHGPPFTLDAGLAQTAAWYRGGSIPLAPSR